MAGEDVFHVDPVVMQSFAVSTGGAAEHLMDQLTELDDQVGQMLGGWRGESGTAYASAWKVWHQGAREVHVGLSMLAHLVGQAGGEYQSNEAGGAQAMRAVLGD
jgi:WXG100 family type VII secretion target